MRPRLYIFAKAPVMGAAKTRLARDIGPVHAKRIYRAMTAQILRQTADLRWDSVLAVTPARALGQVPDWAGQAQIPQVQGSLSPRLAAIFANKGPTVVIGTDCPQVCARDIVAAFAALRRHDFVFGPAHDGGFWLMGVRGPLPKDVFDAVRWSHPKTLHDVQKALAQIGPNGLKVSFRDDIARLRTLTDVDDLKALRAYRSHLLT